MQEIRNEYYENSDNEKSISHSTEDLLGILRDGETSDNSQFPLTDPDDYIVEIKIDLDSSTEDSSAMGSCYKMCRLCARLVYEHKLTSIFKADNSANLVVKINRLLPEKFGKQGQLYFYVLIPLFTILWMDEERKPRQMMEVRTEERRGRGRPRMSYIDNIENQARERVIGVRSTGFQWQTNQESTHGMEWGSE
ncbi:hypothetical protein C0J52_02223 [Blattella germanica]|nr:hypothetical protein C0J52_02223 [Blattella germanica]